VKEAILASVVIYPQLCHVLQQALKFETAFDLLKAESRCYEFFCHEKLLQSLNAEFKESSCEVLK